MIKALSWGFRKHLARFHMLTAKACAETVRLKEFSTKDLHNL